MAEELFELYNEDGTPSGVLKPRSLVHKDGDLHGASHVWVFRRVDDRMELLLQKRSDDKDSFPGDYDISAAGHLDPGESFLQGAVRELGEELGIQAGPESLQYLDTIRIDAVDHFHGEIFHNREIMYIYLYELIPGDQEIIYQESEISGIMWMEAETMCRMAADNAFRHCLRMDEVEVVLKELRIRKRMQKQLDFLLLADREKEIGRQTYKTSLIKENDAEHAWHMALYVMLMAEHANVEVDRYRTMCMVLIHDIVEIYAGDTYAYDEAGKACQEERERAAADRLFAVLPDDQAVWMRGLWDEFEAQRTPEARFARTLDNFQPLLLNHATDGKSWVEHGVKKEQPYKRNANTHLGSERMWNYADSILREHILKKHLQ